MDIVKYEASGQEITLTNDIIKKYLVSGEGKITDKEFMMFTALCKMQKLNPFLREVYLIKYSDKSSATMVTGKETFLKRAQRNPKYKGHETGISIDGKVAWSKIHVEGYAIPIEVKVDFDEYVGLKDEYVNGKKTGEKIPNAMWTNKPRTMLKKVALVQALREAFTEDLGGLYAQEEINTIHEVLPNNAIEIPPEQKTKGKATNKPTEATKKTTDNFDFLDTMQEQKKRVGEVMYYNLFKTHGYKKSNEIVKREDQLKIYGEIKKLPSLKKGCTEDDKKCEYSEYSDGQAFCKQDNKECKYQGVS